MLSNTTDADSIDAEITAEGTDVIVTWWEHNQTDNVPAAKISNDAGETFGEAAGEKPEEVGEIPKIYLHFLPFSVFIYLNHGEGSVWPFLRTFFFQGRSPFHV